MSETMTLGVKPLAPKIGAEITGVDISRPLGEAEFKAIHGAWLKHQVLVFRNQTLSEDQQIDFGRLFGEIQTVRSAPGLYKNPYVLMVSNVVGPDGNKGALPDGEMQFHSDQCYRELPSQGSMLHAITIPSAGGDTLFANCYSAYDTLPRDVKQRLVGLRARQVYDYNLNPTQRGTREIAADVPTWVHPVVRIHPATGRKALYVSRLMTSRIEGLAEHESDQLLNLLFDHVEQAQFIYSHAWQKGDVLMWDNRCALHARTNFDPAETRLMRRITLMGEPVVAG